MCNFAKFYMATLCRQKSKIKKYIIYDNATRERQRGEEKH